MSKKFEKEIYDIIKIFLSRKSGGEYPETLRNIIYHLQDKLLEDILEMSNSMFGDLTTIFKAGALIINALLQKNIILKNLSNLSPSIFERLNDFYKDERKTVIRDLYPQYLALFNDFLEKFESNFKGIKFLILIK